MSILVKDMYSSILKIQSPPKPQTVCIQKIIDPFELECRKDHYQDMIRNYMARELADHIVHKCSIFEVPSYLEIMRGKAVRMELTINDRGAYEGMLPYARDEGRREGQKKAIDSLPYGLNPQEIWE